MDTAGKAVLFSGATVLITLSAVMLVPCPAFRSMALGIMLAVLFVLAASLTLLPAVLGKLGPKVDKRALRWVHTGEHRSPLSPAWGERLWRHPLRYGPAPRACCSRAAGLRAAHRHALHQGRPHDRQLPPGLHAVQQAFGPGAPGSSRSSRPAARPPPPRSPAPPPRHRPRPPHPAQPAGKLALIQAVPTLDPSSRAVGTTIDRLRAALPAGTLVGGAAAENLDLTGPSPRPRS